MSSLFTIAIIMVIMISIFTIFIAGVYWAIASATPRILKKETNNGK